MNSDLKIAVAVKNKELAVMWVPAHCEPDLLPVLEGILHPETISEKCRELVPENAEDLLQLILASLHISWEDIPDPGATSSRNN